MNYSTSKLESITAYIIGGLLAFTLIDWLLQSLSKSLVLTAIIATLITFIVIEVREELR